MTVAETIEKIATVKEGVEKEKLIIISLIANHNEKKKKNHGDIFIFLSQEDSMRERGDELRGV